VTETERLTMIVVTTAGKVGSETVRLLRERDLPVRVLAPDPAKPAQELNVVASAACARDVAAVAARVAVGPAANAGKTYWLTGPELVSSYDVTAALSRLLGRTIAYRELTVERTRTR
jgi:uncharacterized protein YbjT (DUF2867 family)